MSELKRPSPEKFQDPKITAKGEQRAVVPLIKLQTLWFNTGTVCNLSCENCYIESSPQNDRLSFITQMDVAPYLDEILDNNLATEEIAFTGGEPFVNPHFLEVLDLVLSKGFKALVLTNAYKALNKTKTEKLVELNKKYPQKLLLRVSLDHYTQELHEKERGPQTFHTSLKKMQELSELGFDLAIAGRSLKEEDLEAAKTGYKDLMAPLNIKINYDDPHHFMVFPEMDETIDVPEITTACWGILGKTPKDVMCSSSRMIVKRKGEQQPVILACTLLAYDKQFELGHRLMDAKKNVYLNHPHCAKFCVLGGASCSG